MSVCRTLIVLVLLLVLTMPITAQEPATPIPTESFVVPPTATFGPDIDILEGNVTARFVADTLSPLTGEPFMLTLIVEVPAGRDLKDWPEFPDTWGDFDVQAIEPRTVEIRDDDTRIYTQMFTAILWRPGDVFTPETVIGYSLGGDASLTIPVRELFFSVPTVIDFSDQTLRPMKPPVYLPYISPWLLLLIMLILIGTGGLFWRWWRSRPQPEFDYIDLTPGASALMSLEAVKSAPDLSISERYARTANVLRGYLTERFDLPAATMTTHEILTTLEMQGKLDEIQRKDLGRVLTEADLIKYAAADADETIAGRVSVLALRWIEAVESGQSKGVG